MPQCSGWHTLQDLIDEYVAGGIDGDALKKLVLAFPGGGLGFGDTIENAKADAKAKARKQAEEFCKLLQCSDGGKCGEDNFKFRIDAEEQGPVDCIVVITVTRVKCKCSPS